MYKETLGRSSTNKTILEKPSIPKPGNKPSKVNMICDAFLEALHARNSSHLQNIITAHVCKNPPDLDAGLNEISRLRSRSPDESKNHEANLYQKKLLNKQTDLSSTYVF
jgi:elongator complex protein 1